MGRYYVYGRMPARSYVRAWLRKPLLGRVYVDDFEMEHCTFFLFPERPSSSEIDPRLTVLGDTDRSALIEANRQRRGNGKHDRD